MICNLKSIAAVGTVAALVTLGNAQIYEQTAATDNGYFSDGVAGQFYNNRMADNFTLGSAENVGGITWSGGTENFFGPTNLGNFSGFVIRIYSDAAGAVGGEVWNMTFSTAATNPVFSGNFNVAGGEIYDHSVSTGGIALGAGSYWISIGSVQVVAGDDAYAWSTTTNVYDGALRGDNPFGSGYGNAITGDDLVFGLHTVPEPGTFIALGAGLAGLFIARRRK
jgi:hypothetical protein